MLLSQIMKLKTKRKWRRSDRVKEEPIPDPTEMAHKRMEEMEKQYMADKEVHV